MHKRKYNWVTNRKRDPWFLPVIVGITIALVVFLAWGFVSLKNSGHNTSNQLDTSTGGTESKSLNGNLKLKVENNQGQPDPSASAGLQGSTENTGLGLVNGGSPEVIQGSPSPQGPTGTQDLQGSQDALQFAGQEAKHE